VTKQLTYTITLMITIMAIYGSSIFAIGFMSDDFTLLSKAQSHNFFYAMEGHHHSLLINSLFKLAANAIIGPSFFHVLALFLHIANAVLVMIFLQSGLNISPEKAFLSALLFAINSAGVEAIVWCCAIPYTGIATIILISMTIYARWISHQHLSGKIVSLILTLLLIIGFIIWDWAILILPLLSVIALTMPSDIKLNSKVKVLILPAITLFSILLFRNISGMSLGYHLNTIPKAIGSIVLSPFIGIIPFLPKTFYSSILGIVLSTLTFSLLTWLSTRSKKTLLLFVVFLLCQVPQALFGHPQSRYFYFSSFALYAIIIISIPKNPRFVVIMFILICSSAALYRVELWKQASTVVQKMLYQINSTIDQHDTKIAIGNMPDSYGPEMIIWRPFLWRCGREIFHGQIKDDTDGTLPVYHIDDSYNLIEGRE